MEQTEEAIAARKLIYQGDQAYAEGDLEAAREAYRRGCASWASLLQNCEEEKRRREAARVLDSSTPDDVADIFVDDVRTVVRRYMIILDKLDDTFPEDFALRDFVHDRVNKASETVAARGMILKGDQAMAAADPKEPEESLRAALKSYEDAMVQWRKVLDEFPSLLLGSDPESLAEIDQTIRKYVDILRKLDEPFPANFILRDVLDAAARPGK